LTKKSAKADFELSRW